MRLARNLLTVCVLLAALTVPVACKRSTEELSANTETYPIKGTIVAVDGARGEVTLQHDAVPGFMPAMTMPYQLLFGNTTSELHTGDVIRARIRVEKTSDGTYRNARLDEIAVLAQARPDFKPQSSYHVPTAGDRVPDFRFTNQDGKAVKVSDFRGDALLITFIYTRCPLGDFCPKMSRNFAAIERAVRPDAKTYERTRLLSISFDPAFDTPAVLRSYGLSYTGSADFGHWQFVVPIPSGLEAVEHYFNVGVTGSGASLTHSLSTVLIDPDGKIAAWYPGNEWGPGDVAAKMKSLITVDQQTSRTPSASLVRSNRAHTATP